MRKFKASKYNSFYSPPFCFSCIFLIFAIFIIFSGCGKKGDPTLRSYEKPETPANLNALKRTDKIILNWYFPSNKETTLKGFNILRSSLNSLSTDREEWSDFEKIAFVDKKTRTYIDSSINNKNSYKYKIISQSLKDILSKESNVIQVSSVNLPEPPIQLSYKIENDKQIILWQEIVPNSAYNIYKSNIKGIYQSGKINRNPVKGSSFTDNLDINKISCYIVRTTSGEQVIYESNPSQEICIDPKEFIPAKPLNLQAATLSDSVVLVWEGSSEMFVTGYKIYRETDRKNGFILIGETKVPAFKDNERASTKRSYRVAAVGPSKEGPAAEIKDIIYVKPK